jgi:TetR/AcrR family transcriptional regulator
MGEELSTTTEERIKQAAAKKFIEKGFSRTTIRDIAEEAGINVALLNYYFRSKEKLFQFIMEEEVRSMFDILNQILESESPLQVKIWQFADKYIDYLRVHPNVPLFILSEMRHDVDRLADMMGKQSLIYDTRLAVQLQEEAELGNIRPISPLQFIISLVSLLAFPFMARPMITRQEQLSEEGFNAFLEERKQLVPELMSSYLFVKK